jgi:hypothetical protein
MEPHFPDADADDPDSESQLDALLEEVARPSAPRAIALPALPHTLDIPPAALTKLLTSQLPGVGDVLDGRFRIERVLGRGGMGIVFESTNLRTQARVALKWMLPYGDDRDAEMAVRFRREAYAAASIRHRHVVEVYDVAGPDTSLFLVMELLKGESLRTRIQARPLSLPEAVHVMRGALSGVAAAHKAGIVHRDLKPDNIFLCRPEAEGPEVPKVLDFGVAALRRSVDSSAGLTRSGAIVGTPMYMAPEQFKGAHVDERTDIYSLGVVFYEMLSGHLPFAASTGPAIAILQATTKPTPLWAYRPELPRAVHELVARALERSPDARFQSAEQFLAALDALPLEVCVKPPRRTTAVLAILAAGALGASALVYFAVRHTGELKGAPAGAEVQAKPAALPLLPDAPRTAVTGSVGEAAEAPLLAAPPPPPSSRAASAPAPTRRSRAVRAAPREPGAKKRSATSLQLDDFRQ